MRLVSLLVPPEAFDFVGIGLSFYSSTSAFGKVGYGSVALKREFLYFRHFANFNPQGGWNGLLSIVFSPLSQSVITRFQGKEHSSSFTNSNTKYITLSILEDHVQL